MITAIIGGACLLYYAAMALYAGADVNFGWFWVALGGAFLAVFLTGRSSSRTVVLGGRVLLAVLILGLLILTFFGVKVCFGMRQNSDAQTDYAIVLGAEVKGTRPSRSLLMRLQKAESYALDHPDTILILSGGMGKGEDITEAQCMFEYLTQKGIPKERLVLEERSTTTRENLQFSDELTGCAGKTCGIISNSFHICRALLLAEEAGYQSPVGIPAKSDPLLLAHLVVREATALTVMKLKGGF